MQQLGALALGQGQSECVPDTQSTYLCPMQATVLILDFGSQYTQLIARRLRELHVYCEIHPWNKAPDLGEATKGVILSGSPFSVREVHAPRPSLEKYRGQVPLLGICFGAQLLAYSDGGDVAPSETREYGRARLSFVDTASLLTKGIAPSSQVWMSHGDTIVTIPDHYRRIFGTQDVTHAGFQIEGEPTYGVQFHPEVYHSVDGKKLLENFVKSVCHCQQDWTPEAFVERTVADLRSTLGTDHVILGLSGGVDSSVAAVLLNRAIGSRLHCFFVDNGLLRKNEFEEVLEVYKKQGINVTGVDAKERFYAVLKGEKDPERKRKAIGRAFVDVFESAAKGVAHAKWLAQGTIYPDVIESISTTGGPSATIKSHHNVGGLPDEMNLKVVEPLRLLFKDEVRNVGEALEMPKTVLRRHPFPGPGLGIRTIGEVTPQKVRVLQEADHIFIEALKREGLYDAVWQAGVVLLPVRSVGVMGDERTYENVVALRAVTSTDGMTADWFPLPHSFLAEVSSAIMNRVKGINRVTYDISSKPPATIEWE